MYSFQYRHSVHYSTKAERRMGGTNTRRCSSIYLINKQEWKQEAWRKDGGTAQGEDGKNRKKGEVSQIYAFFQGSQKVFFRSWHGNGFHWKSTAPRHEHGKGNGHTRPHKHVRIQKQESMHMHMQKIFTYVHARTSGQTLRGSYEASALDGSFCLVFRMWIRGKRQNKTCAVNVRTSTRVSSYINFKRRGENYKKPFSKRNKI